MNVVVTGGTGGLGIEIVKQHIAAGDKVWAMDLKESDGITALKNAVSEKQLEFISCDISSTENVERKLKNVVETVDKIERIYSCAGICRPQDRVPLEKTDLDAIAKVVDINAVGFLRVVKVLLPKIKEDCAIVCVTSEAASITNNHRSQEYSYGMSKCAENMACVILQQYFDESVPGARVVCIHPGWLKTQMGGGDMAEVHPADSARDLIGIANEIKTISKDKMFIDHKRIPMPW